MIVRQVAPGVTVGAVVLPDGAPGALRQIRTPLVPGIGLEQVILCPPSRLVQPTAFSGHEPARSSATVPLPAPSKRPRSGARPQCRRQDRGVQTRIAGSVATGVIPEAPQIPEFIHT